MPGRPANARNRWAVAYWTCAVLAYATLGAFFQPFFLLGFWESLPFLFIVTWLAGRLLGRSSTDPGPVLPAPPAEPPE
ncbi:MAG: hypothetical protein AB7V42_13965 [Thermoleophilia bacterium]